MEKKMSSAENTEWKPLWLRLWKRRETRKREWLATRPTFLSVCEVFGANKCDFW